MSEKPELSNTGFFSLAPYFFNESGHYRAYHTELLKTMRRLNVEAFIFIPYACQVLDLGERWIRHFRHSDNRWVRLLLRIFDYSKVMKIVSNSLHRKKILFIESYSFLDLISLIFAFVFCSKKEIELWQVFRDGLEWNPVKRKLLVFITRVFHLQFKENYKGFTDSSRILDSLNSHLNIRLHLLPIPHSETIEQSEAKLIHNQTVRLWLPGKARFDKGTKEIIKFCLKNDSALRKIELRIEFLAELVNVEMPKVTWIKTNLSRAEYVKNLQEIDAVLLPYDPIIYISRTSGPFVEAICAGKMVFTQDGNWIAYELKKNDLEECILDWDAPTTPSDLLSVLRDKNVRGKLARMQKVYSEFHNSKNFSSVLGGFIESEKRFSNL